jgi:hypothetical protein
LITTETESEIAEMSSWDQANRGEKLGFWFGEIERQLAKLSRTTFTSLLTVLPLNYFIGRFIPERIGY